MQETTLNPTTHDILTRSPEVGIVQLSMEVQVTPLTAKAVEANLTVEEAKTLVKNLQVAILQARGFRAKPKTAPAAAPKPKTCDCCNSKPAAAGSDYCEVCQLDGGVR